MEQLRLAAVFVLALSLMLGSSFGNEQYITLYSESNQQGSNLTLDRHYANLSEHKPFLNNATSYCAVGWIIFYTQPNYNLEGGVAFLIDNSDAAPKCQNRIFNNFNSMRYLGNKNTDVPSVSLYSKANYHGLEVLVNQNGTASGDLSFPVLSLVATGWGNYTFYEGSHLNGSSWCIESTKKVTVMANIETSLSFIGSVASGCDNNSTSNYLVRLMRKSPYPFVFVIGA